MLLCMESPWSAQIKIGSPFSYLQIRRPFCSPATRTSCIRPSRSTAQIWSMWSTATVWMKISLWGNGQPELSLWTSHLVSAGAGQEWQRTRWKQLGGRSYSITSEVRIPDFDPHLVICFLEDYDPTPGLEMDDESLFLVLQESEHSDFWMSHRVNQRTRSNSPSTRVGIGPNRRDRIHMREVDTTKRKRRGEFPEGKEEEESEIGDFLSACYSSPPSSSSSSSSSSSAPRGRKRTRRTHFCP